MPLTIDTGDSIDAQISNGFARLTRGDGWDSGFVATFTSPDSLQIDVTAGIVTFASAQTAIGAQSVTLQPGHPDYPRKDLVIATSGGAVEIRQGAPAPAEPRAPDGTRRVGRQAYRPECPTLSADAGNAVALWSVWVPAGASDSQEITDATDAAGVDALRDRRLAIPPYSQSSGATQAYVDDAIATHTADASAHHARYTDSEAQALISATDAADLAGSGSNGQALVTDGTTANWGTPATATSATTAAKATRVADSQDNNALAVTLSNTEPTAGTDPIIWLQPQ